MTPKPNSPHTRARVEGLEQASSRVTPRGNASPRLALRWPGEVAAALGVGDDFVKRAGLISELRAVRIGSQRFVPVSELERWLTENARLPLDDAPAERRSA